MSCRSILTAALFVFLANFPSTRADSPAAEPLKDLDEFVARALKEFEVPGLSLAIVKDGKVVLAKGYGVRTLGESPPVSEKTLFAIGSCSKAFTAAALGLLVEDGKAKWDDPVTKYVRGFELYDPYVTREMTLRDLLSHRCGLDRHDFVWYGTDLSRDEVIKHLRYAKPASSFRSKFGYQNVMFLTAGQVIPSVTEKSWDTFVKERLFEPLGMRSSNTSIRQLPKAGDVATPHERVEEKVQTVPWRNIDNVGPAGSINSNAEDMAHWVRFQLDGCSSGKDQLLTSGTLEEMHKSQTVIPLEGPTAKLYPHCHFRTYGLGWFLNDYRGQKVVEHGGNIDGMSALVALLPEQKLGLVVLTNRGATSLPAALKYHIFDAFLHAAPTDWVKEIADVEKSIRKLQKEAEEKEEKTRVAGTKPTLPLEKYAGVYRDDLYGKISVTLEGDKLKVVWGPLKGDLEHWQYDTFRAKSVDKKLPKPFTTFHLAKDGKVEEMKVSLGGAGEWTAKRTGDATALAPTITLTEAQLRRFVAKYELKAPPIEVSIELVGGNLKLVVPGQPLLALAPVKPTRFKAADLGLALFVEFQTDGDKITGLQLEAPDQPKLKLTRKQ